MPASRIALIGCGAKATSYLDALRSLGLRPALFVDADVAAARAAARGAPVALSPAEARERFDVAIVTGIGAGIDAALEALQQDRKPFLCAPEALAAAPCSGEAKSRSGQPLSFSGSHLRFAAGAQRVRSLLRSGAIGAPQSIDARFGQTQPAARSLDDWDRRIAGGGVLIDPGIHVLDLLGWWLESLTPLSLGDDSDGGVEAEALARFSAGSARGEIELSRLRRLRNSIVLTGTGGRLEFDLVTHALRAEPVSLLGNQPKAACASGKGDSLHCRCIGAWLAAVQAGTPSPPESLQAGDAIATAHELYRRRKRVLHAWERTPTPASSSLGSALAGRPVLVTGATGFIGARLVERLAEHRAKVTVVARNVSRLARLARVDVRLVQADLERAELDALVRGQDIVFSLAYDFRRSGAHNLTLHRRVADACARARVGRLVHLSSIAVYDDWPVGTLDEASPRDAPGSEYKSAKRAMEIDLAERAADGSLASVILQPTIVYGPYSALWTDAFVEHFRNGRIELPSDGLGTCSGVYVDDVVAALIAAASHERAAGQAYIVSGPRAFDWEALIAGYAEALGSTVQRGAAADPARRSPARTLNAAPRALRSASARGLATFARRWLGEDRVEALRSRVFAALRRAGPSVYRPADEDPVLYRSRGRCSVAKAARELDFVPAFDLPEGLERTQDYVRWRYLGAAIDAGLSRAS